MKHLLKQETRDSLSNAGFDAGLVYLNKGRGILRFAGAVIPLFYVEGNEVNCLKGNRQSIGYRTSDATYEFTEHELGLKPGMALYLTTDGYLDQLGGRKGFPFGKKRFQRLLQQHHQKPMAEQQRLLMTALADYQGREAQVDDLTLVGLRI
jgi:serine phosphatase RsbU (regulator of sigma subunit)